MRKYAITVAALSLIGLVTFGYGLGSPLKANFDEFHYVPAAKELLSLNINRNWEHPPLGKYFIALGIVIGGDTPIGWRWMSVLFGTWTLIVTFFLALEVFENRRTAMIATALTYCNHLLFVQSRIAMLDIYMLFFLWLALWAFVRAWKGNRRALKWCGISIGLAASCKWFAIVPWIGMGALIKCCLLMRKWRVRFAQPKDTDWYSERAFRGVDLKTLFFALGLIPVATYLATFLPLFLLKGQSYGWSDLWNLQVQMWDGQKRVVGEHPYNSHWTQWIFLSRPMWYAFDRDPGGSDILRGVFLVGNPLLMWLGVLGVAGSFWIWVQTKSRSALFVVYFYLLFYLCWSVIPRKVNFYYYYMPAGMMLSFAVAECLQWCETRSKAGTLFRTARWASVGVVYVCALTFLFFYPILSGMPIPSEAFRRWMWFSSWI